ncbi:MAG: HD domain-containing protein [Eubacterium sp.]|nr:HD domain-containing protein [Eubacterium sp.]
MERVSAIMADDRYIKRMEEIKQAEVSRKYCRHGYEHLLSVARIAYILSLEDNLDIKKDVIYGTALLHDIARFSELEKKTNHRIAGPVLAKPILTDAGYSAEEVKEMCEAIELHGTFPDETGTLAAILYRADKLSRNCFDCEMTDTCNWPDERKNLKVME